MCLMLSNKPCLLVGIVLPEQARIPVPASWSLAIILPTASYWSSLSHFSRPGGDRGQIAILCRREPGNASFQAALHAPTVSKRCNMTVTWRTASSRAPIPCIIRMYAWLIVSVPRNARSRGSAGGLAAGDSPGFPELRGGFSTLLSRQRGNAGCQVLGPVAGGFDGPALRRHLAGGCQRENSRGGTWQAGASAKTAAVGNRMSDAIMSSGHV